MEQNGWYDLSSTEFWEVVGVRMVGALTVGTSRTIGRNNRFLRHGFVLSIPGRSQDRIVRIFTTIVQGYLERHQVEGTKDIAVELVKRAVELYLDVARTLLPVPSSPHYLFSMRHVSRIVQGMLRAPIRVLAHPTTLAILWRHECFRSFYDGLTDRRSQKWFIDAFNSKAHDLPDGAFLPEYNGSDIQFCSFAPGSNGAYDYIPAAYERSLRIASGAWDGDLPALPTVNEAGSSSKGEFKAANEDQAKGDAGPVMTNNRTEGEPSGGGTSQKKTRSKWRKIKTIAKVAGQFKKAGQIQLQRRMSQMGGSGDEATTLVGEQSSQSLESELSLDNVGDAGDQGSESTARGHRQHQQSDQPSSSEQQGTVAETSSSATVTRQGSGYSMQDALASMFVHDGRESERILEALASQCRTFMEQYNDSYPRQPLDMVVFKEVVGHIGRLVRTLEQDAGHVLLLGQGGTGRRSLSRLAGFILGHKICEIVMKPGYTAELWREELKDLLQTAGVIGRPVMLLVRDSSQFAPTVLDDLSHLANRAEIPGLFDIEEVENICNSLKPFAEAQGVRANDLQRVSKQLLHHTVMRIFAERCRTNLRIVLCLEHGGELLRRRLQDHPALGHCLSANYVEAWGLRARSEIAAHTLGDHIQLGLAAEEYQTVVSAMVQVQEVASDVADGYSESGGHNYRVTGSEFLSMIRYFSQLFPGRRMHISSQRASYELGVERMEALRRELQRLQENLAAMRPMIQRTVQETDEIMGRIEAEQAQAEVASRKAANEQELATRDAATAAQLRDVCNAELAAAMPPLMQALAELALVNKRDIAELKALKSPPYGIKLVMEAICILLGQVPKDVRTKRMTPEERSSRFWEQAMKVVSDFHFLETLLTFDKDAMTDEVVQEIKGYVELDQFSPKAIERVSKAATCMCRWVRALSLYHDTRKVVEPKKTALAEAERDLAEKEEHLRDTLERLRAIQESIARLKQEMQDMIAKKEQLEREEVTTLERIVKAKKLLENLQKEGDRWKTQAEAFAVEEAKVRGDVLLASAFLAFAGPMTDSHREELVSRSMDVLRKEKVEFSENFSLADITDRSDEVGYI